MNRVTWSELVGEKQVAWRQTRKNKFLVDAALIVIQECIHRRKCGHALKELIKEAKKVNHGKGSPDHLEELITKAIHELTSPR